MKQLFLIAALVAAPCTAASPLALSDVKFEVFSVQVTDQSMKKLGPRDAVPFKLETSCYRWRMTFAPFFDAAQVEETLAIPAAAAEWGAAGQVEVADDRKSAMSTIDMNTLDGVASNMWCVAAGDPQGPYRFTVRYRGQIVGDQSFYVGDIL